MSQADLRAGVESKLCEFVGRVLLFGQAPDLDRSTPLFELGILDSMGTINLLSFIEDEFGIEIPLEEIEAIHLRNISTIADMILHRL